MAPVDVGDDTTNFVNTVRGIGFAMSVDIAEIANTVNGAPVTVLDVVAVTDRDGGALKKLSDFAEQLESLPDADNIESAARSVRHILDNVINDLRALGNDGANEKDRPAPPPPDPHNYADAIKQMIEQVKDLMKQTAHTGGGLTSALTSFISPDGHTARYLVQTNLYPFGTGALDQIREITDTARGTHPEPALKGASISVSGITAMLRDIRAYYFKDISLIVVMTILIVFLILVALLRAVVAPLYLIASVVISYLSAFGIGVIVFQFILTEELTWSIPGLTFIVLVAMGADYNLLLISRLREESPHGIRSGCDPHGEVNRRRDHSGGRHLRRLDVRHAAGQHQHPGASGLHHRCRASARHLLGADHHRAGDRRAVREGQLVAVATAAARTAAAAGADSRARVRDTLRDTPEHVGVRP